MSTEQEDLINAVVRGESDAFAQLAEPYRAELQRFALRIVDGDAGLGEEVLQEAMLSAYRSIREGARPENVRAWLYVITRNCALNALRGRRPMVSLTEDSYGGAHDTAVHEVERREWMEWLMGAIVALPPRQRDALVASAFEGRSQQEIAGSMGTSVPAVKTLLHRARRTLQAAQPSSLVAVPVAAITRVRGAGAHARNLFAAKLGTKGIVAAGLQVLVAATVATGVAIVAHGAAGPVPASALTPRGGLAARTSAQHAGHRDRRGRHETRAAKVRREGRRALRECARGRLLSRGLSHAALRYAARHMPEEMREYTECEGALWRAQLRRSQRHRSRVDHRRLDHRRRGSRGR